jgi:hypothetical protein
MHISACHGQLYGLASWPPTMRVSSGGIGVRPQSSTAFTVTATKADIVFQYSLLFTPSFLTSISMLMITRVWIDVYKN